MPSIASASEDALPPLPQSGRCLLPLWEGAPGSIEHRRRAGDTLKLHQTAGQHTGETGVLCAPGTGTLAGVRAAGAAPAPARRGGILAAKHGPGWAAAKHRIIGGIAPRVILVFVAAAVGPVAEAAAAAALLSTASRRRSRSGGFSCCRLQAGQLLHVALHVRLLNLLLLCLEPASHAPAMHEHKGSREFDRPVYRFLPS